MSRPVDWSRRAAQAARTVAVAPEYAGAPIADVAPLHITPTDAYSLDRERAQELFEVEELQRANDLRAQEAKMKAKRMEVEAAELDKRLRAATQQDDAGGTRLIAEMMRQAAEDRRAMMETLTTLMRRPDAPAVPPELTASISALNQRIDSLSSSTRTDPVETAVRMVETVAKLRGAIDEAVPDTGRAVPVDPVELAREQGNNIRLAALGDVQRLEAQRVVEEAQQKAAAKIAESAEKVRRTELLTDMVTKTLEPVAAAIGAGGIGNITQALGLSAPKVGNQTPQGGEASAAAAQTDTWHCEACGADDNVVTLTGNPPQPPAYATCAQCGASVRFR